MRSWGNNIVSNKQRQEDFLEVADNGEETDIAKIAKEHDIRNPEKVLTELSEIAGDDYEK